MSFSNLVGGGAECGPSNPLATLGKRLGQDNGPQRDRYGAGPSSTSAQGGMRTQQEQQQQQQQHNSPAFFGRQGPGPAGMPYDMSNLHQALPHGGMSSSDAQRAAFEHSFRNSPQHAHISAPAPAPAANVLAPVGPAPAWAQDFLKSSMQSGIQHQQQQQQQSPSTVNPLQRPAYAAQFGTSVGAYPWQSGMHYPSMQTGLHAESPHAAVHAANQQQQATAEPAWATAFAAFDQQQHDPMDAQQEQEQPQGEEPQKQQRPLNTIEDADELAQTAGRLMETIAHEEDAKFKQSRFLDLMRRLRDREAGIEGDDIVATDPNAAPAATRDLKGKGRAMPDTAIEEYQTRLRHQYQSSDRGMDLGGPASMRAPSQEAMAEMNDIWAEEDAQREGGAQKKGSFVGDGGDVAARMDEDLAAAREFERYQRLGAQMPGSHSADWAESLNGEGRVGTGTDEDAYTSYAPQFGAGSGAFNELRRAAMREPLTEHPSPQAETSRQGEAAQEQEEEQEEEDGIRSTDDFVGRKWEGSTGRGRAGHQTAEWDTLQRDWDEFEATSMGIRPVSETTTKPRSPSFSQFTNIQPQPYRFAPNNPYQGRTKHHLSHWDGLHKSYATPAAGATVMEDSVLEREAAVQDDPTNAQAWYDLGVKQQENEREGLAISALHRAVQLDPKLQGAWLALAVSYTNENDRPAALEAIVRWMDSVEGYSDVLVAHRGEVDAAEKQQQQRPPADGTHSPISSGSLTPDGLTASAKHQRVTEALIALARHGSAQGQVDADVQVALGVLFNSSEDYDKAVDCFGAALSVRPEDWLLYNRMGATLSNSGRSDEAIKFYHHALSLQPEFVRCHFNLSISYLNLKMYRETAQHIYTALSLQRAESASNTGKAELNQLGNERDVGGVASTSLWETFRVSLELLNRPDLARLCARRDIDAFDLNDFVDPEHDAMTEA
ncbi:unnamed protein product [Tilletia laevis]|uniref:Peroxin-5 n=2 Tax=Tilletia TaxID=13289 RepID=A0A177VCP2_9BASI|nr:hypothetical protein CF336_g5614 [Tilletia laevis]KAE8256936.1 hypothetical protein A4X03_0g4908 [Tilletia caries]KAE8194618.1 hypothetical protein CF335_g5302 [Tilletia laevis]CAD6892545.1 unnamed protein product [Tilletia caries]CAD6912064.1 unnamed protein product [Tilletia caries]